MFTSIGYALLGTSLLLAADKPLSQTVPPEGKQAEARLIAVLQSAEASQKDKADACRQLAIVGSKQAVPALAGLLTDEKLSHMARYALEPIPDPAVDEALRDALGKLKGRLLVGVIASVGVRRDAQAVPALVKLLDDPDSDVAQAAARALGSIGTLEAAKALRAALGKTTDTARQLAICEGLLRAAENLAAKGDRDSARGIYDQLAALPKLPRHVRTAALQGKLSVSGKQ